MKRLFILIFVFAFIGIRAQIAVEQFNQKSYATNYYRPFTGIVDLNLHVPTTRSQAVIAGLHHYSFFYIYDRLNDDNFFNTYGSDRYREWVMGNTLAADYRFYFNPRQGRRVKRIGYLTYINRLAIVQWRETTDLVENSCTSTSQSLETLDMILSGMMVFYHHAGCRIPTTILLL